MSSTDPSPIWICGGISMTLCIVRLVLRKWRGSSLTPGDYWIMLALLLIGARIGLGYYILAYPAPISYTYGAARPDTIPPDAEYFYVLNGKLNLALRVIFVSIFWSFKMAVLDLLSLLVNKVLQNRSVTMAFYVAIGITYIGAVTSVFLDCRPLSLNWQLNPDPGNCVQGNIWLITYETGNIVTDFMLMVLPFPIIFGARLNLFKRLQLIFLFGLGLFLIAVSIMRVDQGRRPNDVQRNRTLWSSIETVVASIVATIPSIYILLRPSGPKADANTPRTRTWPRSTGADGSSKERPFARNIEDVDGPIRQPTEIHEVDDLSEIEFVAPKGRDAKA